MVPPAGAFSPPLRHAFTAGCQGVATGTKIVFQYGNTSGGTYTYSDHSGLSAGAESVWAANGRSGMYAGAYYFVGPPGGGGCIAPSTNVGHLRMTWNWKVWVDPYLAANCSGGDHVSAAATIDVLDFGNVHWASAPFYSFIPHRQSSPDPLVANVTCTGGASQVYSPGLVGPFNVSIRSPTFSLSAGVRYDVYSSVYANDSAAASSNAVAVSLVSLTARFVSASCPACPP